MDWTLIELLAALIIQLVLFVIPFWIILPRAGMRASLSILAIFPFFAVMLLWVIAFSKWPHEKGEFA